MNTDFWPETSADEERLARLSRQLSERAAADGLLDVAYREMDSPVGRLLIAATPAGVVRVAFLDVDADPQTTEDAVLQALSMRISPRVLRAPGRLDPATRELEEYFAGHRRHFEVNIDLQLAQGFRRHVINHLADIPFGATANYAEVAASTGSPRAVRAVGTACARNPLPLLLPCHRVVRSDGSPGQYAGGPVAKRRLLELESTVLAASS